MTTDGLHAQPRLVAKGLTAQRESKYVDFKADFDPAATRDWCEILKDVVAMANTAGGVIMIGLDNSGAPSRADVGRTLEIDPAHVTDKIYRYTQVQFDGATIHECEKDGALVAALVVNSVQLPIVFTRVGSYEVISGGRRRARTAFREGEVYFRHGAKSQLATRDDIRMVVERNLDVERSRWLGRMRQVVEAPAGSHIRILSAREPTGLVSSVRLTNDPSAAPVRTDDVVRDWLDYGQLINTLRDRFIDFKQNAAFYELKRAFEVDPSLCQQRYLDPRTESGTPKKFYSPSIVERFAEHYSSAE